MINQGNLLRWCILMGDAGAFAGRASGGGVTKQVINVIFQLRPAHFQFVNLLIGGEIYLFFDAIDFVVEPVVFVVEVAEVFVGAFEPLDGFTIFGELSQDRMMKVHVRGVFNSSIGN